MVMLVWQNCCNLHMDNGKNLSKWDGWDCTIRLSSFVKLVLIDYDPYLTKANGWEMYMLRSVSVSVSAEMLTYECKTYWHADMLTGWQAGIMTCWHIDMLTCWHADMLTCWHADMLTCWHADMFACWHADRLTCWHVGMLACWHADMRTC